MQREYEKVFLGIDEDISPEHRPIYGMIVSNEFLSSENAEYLPNSYGNVLISMKSDISDRTTFTSSDSLLSKNTSVPSMLKDPKIYSFNEILDRDTVLGSKNIDIFSGDTYVEAQYHGGVSFRDIEEVIFLEEPSKDIVKELYRKGIKFKVL